MRKFLRNDVVLPVVLFISLAILSFVSSENDFPLFFAKFAWSLVVSYSGFCIYRSGFISKYRSILFILIAFFFFLEFKLFRFLSFSNSASNSAAPYCHIAQAPTLFNFIYNQFLAITGGAWAIWGILSLGFLWLLLIFTIGGGICSWVCFYGGIDELCSKLIKKPIIKLNKPGLWRDFPIAFLIFLLIVSFLQGLPVFCAWFCPFKMTEAFWGSYRVVRIAQAVLFWIALIGFLIIFPILTKKRTFCAFICPFGALVSICAKSCLYKVTINKEECIACAKCQEACPMLAIEAEADKYRITNFCNKCGKCIDLCPAQAINILSVKANTRDIFIFLALLLTGVISGSFVPRVILQLMGIR